MTDAESEPANPPAENVEKLTRDHDLTSFHCGKPSLDDWLRRFA
jgi:hypothetical protein